MPLTFLCLPLRPLPRRHACRGVAALRVPYLSASRRPLSFVIASSIAPLFCSRTPFHRNSVGGVQIASPSDMHGPRCRPHRPVVKSENRSAMHGTLMTRGKRHRATRRQGGRGPGERQQGALFCGTGKPSRTSPRLALAHSSPLRGLSGLSGLSALSRFHRSPAARPARLSGFSPRI